MEVPNLSDPELYLGTVVSVGPGTATVNLPFAAAGAFKRIHGRRHIGGVVGDFVCIDSERWVILGRLDEVRLPERDRDAVDPIARSKHSKDPHPIGRVSFLATIHRSSSRSLPGTERPPRLGAQVHLAPVEAIAAALTPGGESGSRISLGTQPRAHDLPFSVSAEAMFDRHCAVIGSTGGGKSWTVARLVEQIAKRGGKVLLLDPTGEYRPPADATRRVRLGISDASSAEGQNVAFPYWMMRNEDLFALFTPAGQMQAPLLREAITSLRLLSALQDAGNTDSGLTVTDGGNLQKARQTKRPYVDAIRAHRTQIETHRGSYFDIDLLTEQLKCECVWQSGKTDARVWGDRDDRAIGFVVPLVMRIESLLSDSRYRSVFVNEPTAPSIIDAITSFMADGDDQVLHVDVSTVPSERHFRQIVINALAGCLLEIGRSGKFMSKPLILFIDEAHQFLGSIRQLDEFGLPLDGIELIAKEGRKYGLHLGIATQRPKDLTRAVMSQMGCIVAHRMSEAEDLEILGSTVARRDAGIAAYAPTLTPGECLVLGSAVPFPVLVRVGRPSSPPSSAGSDFASSWKTS